MKYKFVDIVIILHASEYSPFREKNLFSDTYYDIMANRSWYKPFLLILCTDFK